MAAKDKARIRRIVKENKGHAFLATVDGQQPVVRSVSPTEVIGIISKVMPSSMAAIRSSASRVWVSARLLGRVPALKAVGDFVI